MKNTALMKIKADWEGELGEDMEGDTCPLVLYKE